MKQLFFIIIFCTYSSLIIAQDKAEITGQVKDLKTKNALEFCNIIVVNAKDSIISGTSSDNKGFFSISLDNGVYRFIFSFIGYISDTSEIISVSQNKFIGVFKLAQDENVLKEVTVKESSRETQIDRDVQVVTDKMKEGASNTKEVLDKINGVDYDRYNNSIKVDNDSKVIILVDGIEKDQEYVKNLSPERLKKVEVIRDPGGRYALEGYSAVINIILKKDYRGTEIYFEERAMVDPDALKKEYLLVQNGINGTVNYIYNNVNIYGKYSNNINNFNFNTENIKSYNNGYIIEKKSTDNSSMNTNIIEQYNKYTVGADYFINPKNTISYEGNLSSQPFKNNISKFNFATNYYQNDSLLYSIDSKSNNQSTSNNIYHYIYYENKFDDKNIFNTSFTYSNYNNNYTNYISEGSVYSRTENGNDKKNNTRLYLEYTHTFKNQSSLQFGYGNTFENTKTNYTAENVTTNFTYKDLRNKFYLYYLQKLSKTLSIKIGNASETSTPEADNIKHNYLINQPYFDFKYSPNQTFDIKTKFRTESIYPNINQINPYETVSDLQSVRKGNPQLKPITVNKISIQTSILQGLFRVEPYYKFSDNYITESGTLRADSIFEYNISNAGLYKKYGIVFSFTIPFGKSLFLQSDFNIFKSQLKYSEKINNINDWSMSNQLIYQNQKLKTVAGLKYQNNLIKHVTALGYNKDDNDFWILFLQQPFFKEKLNVMLIYFTPITWGVDFEQGNYVKTDTYTESKFYNIDILKNIVMLEISYRFNKGKTINKKEKQVEQINEKNSKTLF